MTLTGANTGSNAFAPVIGDNGAGATSLVKSGAGTWILTDANTFSGGTTISDGTLQVGSGGTTGAIGSGAVTDNATLAFNLSSGGGIL